MVQSDVVEQARSAGLSPYTVWQRMSRQGIKVEEALYPLLRAAPTTRETKRRVATNRAKILKFFIAFCRDNHGFPPNLMEIIRHFGYKGPTLPRNACLDLVVEGKLEQIGHGKYIVAGSRWLAPVQNEALTALIAQIQMMTADPSITALIQKVIDGSDE